MRYILSVLIFVFLSNLVFGQKYEILADNLIDIKGGKVIENPINQIIMLLAFGYLWSQEQRRVVVNA